MHHPQLPRPNSIEDDSNSTVNYMPNYMRPKGEKGRRNSLIPPPPAGNTKKGAAAATTTMPGAAAAVAKVTSKRPDQAANSRLLPPRPIMSSTNTPLAAAVVETLPPHPPSAHHQQQSATTQSSSDQVDNPSAMMMAQIEQLKAKLAASKNGHASLHAQFVSLSCNYEQLEGAYHHVQKESQTQIAMLQGELHALKTMQPALPPLSTHGAISPHVTESVSRLRETTEEYYRETDENMRKLQEIIGNLQMKQNSSSFSSGICTAMHDASN